MSSGILIDSCLFIDHMRTKDKTNTHLAKIQRLSADLYISTVVEYEVELGMTALHRELWNSISEDLTILSFDSQMALMACEIKHGLKKKGIQTDVADLFVAATAIVQELPLATLNRKHFEQIDGLRLLLPVS